MVWPTFPALGGLSVWRDPNIGVQYNTIQTLMTLPKEGFSGITSRFTLECRNSYLQKVYAFVCNYLE